MQFLDSCESVKTWTKQHGLKLRYKMGKRKRRYWPDLLVHYNDGHVVLEEVKGRIFRPREFIKKKWAAEVYCAARGWKYKVIFHNDLEKES